MGKFLPFWGTPKGAPPPETPRVEAHAALGDAVNTMLEETLGVYRAKLKARAAYLRAQAHATDSMTMRKTLDDRADEAEYSLGLIGG